MGLGFKIHKINEKDSRGNSGGVGAKFFAPNGFGQKPIAPTADRKC